MKRADRIRWQRARTLADLGELTAQWLEGRIDSQPNYQPGYGPEEETYDLVPTLTRANRAGYVTMASQPGCGPKEAPGIGVWVQRAAVEGWVRSPALVDELASRARRAGLLVLTYPVLTARFARRPWAAIDVTLCDGKTVTSFGTQMKAYEVDRHYADCGAEAVRQVLDATLVTLAAPDYGPDESLWHLVDDWSGRRRA